MTEQEKQEKQGRGRARRANTMIRSAVGAKSGAMNIAELVMENATKISEWIEQHCLSQNVALGTKAQDFHRWSLKEFGVPVNLSYARWILVRNGLMERLVEEHEKSRPRRAAKEKTLVLPQETPESGPSGMWLRMAVEVLCREDLSAAQRRDMAVKILANIAE